MEWVIEMQAAETWLVDFLPSTQQSSMTLISNDISVIHTELNFQRKILLALEKKF